MPYPGLLHPEPLPCGKPLLHRRHSEIVLAQCLWGLCIPVGTRFVWALWVSLEGKGFDSKGDFAPPAILLGLLLCLWTWGIVFGEIQHSPVNSCSAASCSFGVLAGEHECMSFYSAILCHKCNLKNDRMISVCFQGRPFNITVIQVCALTSNAEEAEVEEFYEDLKTFYNYHPRKMSFSL